VPWYRASFDPAHRDRRVVRSGSHAVRAGGIHDLRDVALLFARASFGGLFPTHRSDVRTSFRPRTPRCPTRLALRGLDEPYTGSDPTSDVLCRLQAPPLGSSPRGQLTARAVTGRAAFTCKPESPHIRPVRSACSNDSERLPSCTAPARSSRVELSFHGARLEMP